MSVKRNLLLGILAFQNSFINEAQLLAGFTAWLKDKSASLSALLLKHRALRAEYQSLLEALVAAHLNQHDQDADRCLAAATSTGRVRRVLAKIADAEVQTSLASLARLGTPSGDDADASATVSAPGVSTIPARFSIQSLHAAGGLGQVWIAQDNELNRLVALKDLKQKHAGDPGAQARFLLEAEITGGLEHPGIAPVYSLGIYSDCRPYYAMRFIRGISLREASDQFHHPRSRPASSDTPGPSSDFHSRDFRKLLGRFVDVCDVVAYAHSRGVMHRDLKPDHVILGMYGETLVVDWGLAKAISGTASQGVFAPGADESPQPFDSASGNSETLSRTATGSLETLPGSALGTPAYMSPEQAAGCHDQLGAATDVYSLGATLYHLLTGKPPFDGGGIGILRQVQAGDFAPPRRLQPAVPAALEAVCLKAMAWLPADRYGSASELAEEIERWLTDEPVRARLEPWMAKARRWTSRHSVLVASIAACLVVAVAALLVGIVLLWQENATIRNRQGATQKANEDRANALE